MVATALKAQQDPQDPWFFTSVTTLVLESLRLRGNNTAFEPLDTRFVTAEDNANATGNVV